MITNLRINAKGELEGKVIPPAKWKEMYTKDEVVAMLTDVKAEIVNVYASNNEAKFIRMTCRDIIQEKINALKAESEDT